jgi:hypothetical protein
VLQLCEREGFAPALRPRRVWRELRGHWDAAWYGVLAVLAWSAAFTVGYIVVGALPFVGGFGVFAVMIPANGLLGLVMAAPLARYDDPPSTFRRTHTNLLLAGLAAMTVLVMVFAWTLTLVTAGIISSHPEETACTFQPGCHFQYSGSQETIARVSHDSRDRTLVRVQVSFINGGSAEQQVDPAQYWISPSDGRSGRTGPSGECAAPAALSVGAHSRAAESVCFRVPDTDRPYDLHLPWTGSIVYAITPGD